MSEVLHSQEDLGGDKVRRHLRSVDGIGKTGINKVIVPPEDDETGRVRRPAIMFDEEGLASLPNGQSVYSFYRSGGRDCEEASSRATRAINEAKRELPDQQ